MRFQINILASSFSNYTLKYVDASFYQIARGLLLPFTVATSYVFLHARPSSRIFVSCSVVTMGFLVGVFMDAIPISPFGITFGIISSAITAVHSVVIKKSLDVVHGSAMHLSWYTNLLSAVVMIPLVLLAGEGPAVFDLFFGPSPIVPVQGELSALNTFIWGSLITVSIVWMFRDHRAEQFFQGVRWLLDEPSQCIIYQGHVTYHTHGLFCRSRCSCVPSRNVAVWRYLVGVCTFSVAMICGS